MTRDFRVLKRVDTVDETMERNVRRGSYKNKKFELILKHLRKGKTESYKTIRKTKVTVKNTCLN